MTITEFKKNEKIFAASLMEVNKYFGLGIFETGKVHDLLSVKTLREQEIPGRGFIGVAQQVCDKSTGDFIIGLILAFRGNESKVIAELSKKEFEDFVENNF